MTNTQAGIKFPQGKSSRSHTAQISHGNTHLRSQKCAAGSGEIKSALIFEPPQRTKLRALQHRFRVCADLDSKLSGYSGGAMVSAWEKRENYWPPEAIFPGGGGTSTLLVELENWLVKRSGATTGLTGNKYNS